ncbi:MAG TPA: ABC transporter substrate-binding protein [Stellaceae bacterium]|jgi:phospholipid transport system substrate-binding protein
MIRPLVAAFGFVLVVATTPVFAQAPAQGAEARQFVSGLGDQVIQLIGDKQAPAAQRKQQFASLVDKSFDVDGIARFILGPYWRTATEQQRADFQQVFKTYMVNVYWADFSQYSGQKLAVTGQRAESPTSTVINSEIEQPNGKPPVKVDWRVASANGGYKITDVTVGGVSELVTYRQEFADVIAQGGGNVATLTDKLRQKNQQTGAS